MIVTAITALAALGTAAWNQYKNNKASKEQRDLNRHEMDVNRQNLASTVYENSMESPTAKGLIENVRRQAERSNNMRDNRNVAGRATHEQMLASKNATNETVANAMNNIVANQERVRAAKNENFMSRDMALNAREQAYKGAEAQARDNLTSNLIGSIADVAGVMGEDYHNWNENKKALKAERVGEFGKADLVAGDVDKNLNSIGRQQATIPNVADLNDTAITGVVSAAANNAAKRNLSVMPTSDEFSDIDTSGSKPRPTNNGNFKWFSDAFKSGDLSLSDYNSYLNKRRNILRNNYNSNNVNNKAY